MDRLPGIEQIIERQVRSWELRRRLAGEGGEVARAALAHLSEGPWLAISRQLGAGGGELAKTLGHELGWPVYDQQILAAIAQQTHSREKILSRLDEQVVAPFQEFLARLLVRDDPSQLGYLKEMIQVVWGLARQGHAIILGRAANHYLDGRFGLRLRLVAPLEERVARVARAQALTEAAARERVLEHDLHRRQFIEQYFGGNIDDPLAYDLVLNTGTLGVETAARTALTALRGKLLAAG